MAARPEPPVIRLERMRFSDVEAVAEIERAAYAFPWTTGMFADCIGSGHECWVARERAEILGYAVLAAGAGEAHLLNVCVRPTRRRRGHGTALVRHMIDRAAGCNARTLFLEVRPSNTAARRMYEDLGFREVGRRRNYYPAAEGREDAEILALSL